MDFEIRSFIKVWIITTTCLCYCYYIASRIPRGIKRLISLFPIFYLFLVLPLKLQSFHLGAPTTFFLVWLGFFKLLLFSFELGPLSPTPPSKLFHFICIASLPIKIKHTSPNIEKPLTTKSTTYPSYQNGQKTQKPLKSIPKLIKSENPISQTSSKIHKSILLAIKVLILAIIIHLYEYRPYLHPYVTLALYCCHMYLGIEIVLALCVVPARILFGFEIEPQFNEPYLSSSLQDFWGRRWNLMVTSILRPTVYGPIRHISTSIVGRKWAPLPAVVSTFAVSGLMHEIIYYYLTRVRPTWEVTWFFVLHGVCTAIEIVVKKAVTGSWRLNKAVSGPLTLGFLAVTGNWLFFPQLLRNGVHEKGIKEYAILVDFVKSFFLDLDS